MVGNALQKRLAHVNTVNRDNNYFHRLHRCVRSISHAMPKSRLRHPILTDQWIPRMVWRYDMFFFKSCYRGSRPKVRTADSRTNGLDRKWKLFDASQHRDVQL